MSEQLFDPGAPVVVRENLSADQRRTIRRNARLAAGWHPVTGLRLREPRGETCGDCEHHIVHHYAKRYHKCDLNDTSGAATDLRVSWPACSAFRASHE